MGGTVSSASLPLTKLTPVAAPMRTCARFDVFHGDLLQCAMEMAAVWMAQVATTSWVCMRQQATRRSDALLTFLLACGPLHAAALIVHQRAEGASWRQRRRRRRYRRSCGGVAGRSTSLHSHPTKIHRCDTRFASTTPTPPLHACSGFLHGWSHSTTKYSRSQPMPCRLQPAPYHNVSPHKQHYPHSQDFTCLFPLPLIALPIIPRSHLPLRMSCAWFCSFAFVSRFCSLFLGLSDFLFFWRDLQVILVLRIFVCWSFFCEFLDSLHFREFLVLIGLLDFLHFREILVLVGFCSVLPAGCDSTSGHDYWGGTSPTLSRARRGNTYDWCAAAPTLFVFVLTATYINQQYTRLLLNIPLKGVTTYKTEGILGKVSMPECEFPTLALYQ